MLTSKRDNNSPPTTLNEAGNNGEQQKQDVDVGDEGGVAGDDLERGMLRVAGPGGLMLVHNALNGRYLAI